MKYLVDKVALVTGGGSGIGRATAIALAQDGAAVAVADLNGDAAAEVAAEIEGQGGSAFGLACDMTDEASARDLVADVLARYGRLDCAHNNVGMGAGPPSIPDQAVADWDRVMDISLKSCFLGLKFQIPAMIAGGGGAIVNTASMAGVRHSLGACPAYSAAKAGVIHLTRYAAGAHAAQNIRVNSISPGLTATPVVERLFTPEQQAEMVRGQQLIERAIRPSEIAEAVLFLISDRSAMVTGTNMEVCGGRS